MALTHLPDLLVFGSLNLDISIIVPRHPKPGETMLGVSCEVSPGGKGANQAHAAQLFGAQTTFVGAAGGDPFAVLALTNLKDTHVDLKNVKVLAGEMTGVANIAVDQNGENSIVVAPGANSSLRAEWVSDHLLASCPHVLMQLEVPFRECALLAKRARAYGCVTFMNAAPMQDVEMPSSLFDYLIVNEIELAQACTAHSIALHGTEANARALSQCLDMNVVTTLGAAGASYVSNRGEFLLQHAPVIRVVDTTGAGDTFVGTFAAAISMGMRQEHALRVAVLAGSLSCEARGAQRSQPTRAALDAAQASRSFRAS